MFNKATAKSTVTMDRVKINPKQAQVLLDHTAATSFPQRTLSPSSSDKYASEMIAGTWHQETADVIRLCDYEGGQAVLDGQHRLMGVVKSGIAQEFWVASGVPIGAFKYIDQGTTRNLNHVMQAAGWPNPSVLSAAGRFLYFHSLGGVGIMNKGSNMSAGTLFDKINKMFPDLTEKWGTYGKVIKKAARRCNISEQALLMFFYLAEEIDHDTTVGFFVYLADSYEASAPHKIWKIMLGRLDENSAEFQKAKDLGREIRTEVRMADQYQVIRFAWLCHTQGISSPTTLLGFNKSHNKWANNGGSASPWNL